jgi:hypothetical protein
VGVKVTLEDNKTYGRHLDHGETMTILEFVQTVYLKIVVVVVTR